MSVFELLLRVLSALKPMVPGMAAAVIATTAALLILLSLSRSAWVEDKRFFVTGLFFGLEKRATFRLACCWLKLVFMVTFIVGFQKLNLLNYLMLLLPGILAAFVDRGVTGRFGSFFWLVLQTAGLLSANLICGYIQDTSAHVAFVLIYLAMAVFLLLFSVYLFLTEIASVSLMRDIDADEVWTGAYEELKKYGEWHE